MGGQKKMGLFLFLFANFKFISMVGHVPAHFFIVVLSYGTKRFFSFSFSLFVFSSRLLLSWQIRGGQRKGRAAGQQPAAEALPVHCGDAAEKRPRTYQGLQGRAFAARGGEDGDRTGGGGGCAGEMFFSGGGGEEEGV